MIVKKSVNTRTRNSKEITSCALTILEWINMALNTSLNIKNFLDTKKTDQSFYVVVLLATVTKIYTSQELFYSVSITTDV